MNTPLDAEWLEFDDDFRPANPPANRPLRVVAGGSRGWRDAFTIRERLAELPDGTEIIHGGALGADYLIGLAADALGFHVRVFRVTEAEWRPQGPGGPLDRKAGHVRNARMLDEKPDLVIAFWDGHSPGTAGLIREARRRGIAVEVISG